MENHEKMITKLVEMVGPNMRPPPQPQQHPPQQPQQHPPHPPQQHPPHPPQQPHQHPPHQHQHPPQPHVESSNRQELVPNNSLESTIEEIEVLEEDNNPEALDKELESELSELKDSD
jgi:hypothetical protein